MFHTALLDYLDHIAQEVRIVVRPIRTSDERNDLHKLVGKETRQSGVVGEKMSGEKSTKLHPLGGVNRQPFISHQIL